MANYYGTSYYAKRRPYRRGVHLRKSFSRTSKKIGHDTSNWLNTIPPTGNGQRRISIPLVGNPRSHTGARQPIHRKKRKFDKIEAQAKNDRQFSNLKGWKKIVAGPIAYPLKKYIDWSIKNADDEGHSPIYNYIANLNPKRRKYINF